MQAVISAVNASRCRQYGFPRPLEGVEEDFAISLPMAIEVACSIKGQAGFLARRAGRHRPDFQPSRMSIGSRSITLFFDHEPNWADVDVYVLNAISDTFG